MCVYTLKLYKMNNLQLLRISFNVHHTEPHLQFMPHHQISTVNTTKTAKYHLHGQCQHTHKRTNTHTHTTITVIHIVWIYKKKNQIQTHREKL